MGKRLHGEWRANRLTLFPTRRYHQQWRGEYAPGSKHVMGPIGFQEMIFIFVFALLIFGPKKLPELGRTFGKGMAEFRRASNELKSTFQREMDNIERETKMDEARKAANDARRRSPTQPTTTIPSRITTTRTITTA
ncbi:MAG: TatA/E family twin arginine-targeting protein translocase [Bryobacterales bacterium]